MHTEPHGRLADGASLFLIAVATLVLAGWILDLPVLEGLAGPITMKANAAVGLLASGLALRWRTSGSPFARLAGSVCAALAGLLGALTFSEHVVGWNLGIDELLFHEEPGAAATTSPGRMGPNASLSLTLAGVALWQLYRGGQRAIARAQVLAACMAVLALVPLVGYLYGATPLYAVARYTGIAVHTGISLLVLSLGILAARPDVGPVAALIGDAPHGIMARRLLAPAIVLPLLLGYLRLVGERQGWYDTGFGLSVMVVAVIVVLSVLIWRTAIALARSERARHEAEQDRDDLLVRERAAREQAERAGAAKDEFIATLSHELRTPLNAIVGWMQMLQQGTVAESTRAKAMDAMSRNASALTRLIEDLVDTSRIATGHLQLSETAVDLNAIVQAAVESVTPIAEAKRVRLNVALSPPAALVMGDAQRLQQVLWNLLSNAVKFSPTSSTVSVQLTVDGRSVVVRIRDEGPGIDPESLPHVFEQFWQGSGATRGNGSLGLGLHIAKHLIERHGGTIEAHSDGIGRGAMFTLQLPVVDAGSIVGHREASPGQNRRIVEEALQ